MYVGNKYNNDTGDVPLDIYVDRMDDTDASTILEMSDVRPTSCVAICAEMCSISVLPTSPPHMESLGSDTELTSDTTTVDSGAETDADDMSPEVGRCGCAQCDYGGGSIGSMDTVVAIITGVSSVQYRTVCRGYVPGAMDLAATEGTDDILNCVRTD